MQRNASQWAGTALLFGALALTFLGTSHGGASAGPVGSPPQSAPSIAAVQSYINRTHLTAHTTTPFDSTGGDLIVICASSHQGVLMTPSDSFHNTWIPLMGPTDSAHGLNLRTQMWYAKDAAVGPNHNLTIILSGPQSLVISLFVVKGADRAAPIDAISPIGEDGGSQSVTVNSPTVQTTSPNDLLIGFGKSSVSETWIAAGGYVAQPAASSDILNSETGWAPSPGQYKSRFDLAAPATWQAAIVAVRPASSAASDQTVSKSYNRQSVKLRHSGKHAKSDQAL